MAVVAYILALDQGTSSSRSIVFDQHGEIVALAQREIKQIYPQPGWVEHDPKEIWSTQLDTARDALAKAKLSAKDIVGIGITNQRETTVVWNRVTGEPLHNAIVWQDRRTEPICAQLRERDMQGYIKQCTGLVIDPYFSATKLKWVLQNVPQAQRLAQKGELAFGTVDSWLIWQLTGGTRHVTDVSNASRTMLFDIRRNVWDRQMLQALEIPESVLPDVLPSSAQFGQTDPAVFGSAIAIGGVAGDQQSALFGQACFKPGMAKNTYGTGCFMLMHTGQAFMPSGNGLITTAAAQPDSSPCFALEGSVFIGGAVVQWLRDGLSAISASSEVQALAQSVPDSAGVMFVPAFTGLGAPYWAPDARGAIVGLSRGSTMAHIARAALESIAFQSAALLEAMNRDVVAAGGVPVTELRVDGGASVNDLLMQMQADLIGIPVVRPVVTETTALGAAYLAGLNAGVFQSLDDIGQQWRKERIFEPELCATKVQERKSHWERAVRQATST
jgi:glycerol kinase